MFLLHYQATHTFSELIISWAMCTTFFLFISSSCWKSRGTNSQAIPPKLVSNPTEDAPQLTHGLAADHHDGWILLQCSNHQGWVYCSSIGFPSVSLSLCVWMVKGRVSKWLNLDGGLGWNALLLLLDPLRGITHRCWRFHEERTHRMKK